MAIGLVMRKGDTNNMNVLEKILEEIEERRGFRETLVKYEKKNGTIVDVERNRCALEELDIVERIIRSHMGGVENDGWIPVSERLPEVPEGTEDDDCPEFNVTIKGADKATTLKYAPDGTWFDDYGEVYKVIAWKPLPEAYKGE
ncbi:MAG: DUF551 domain-containing protein [Eubacteriales bacterium]|nr:DUF551 domain-containing protein [Eubacteriales bacterium]